MPTFEVTDPSGRTLEIEGDRMPTEAELNEIFASMPAQESTIASRAGGVADAALSLGSQALNTLAGGVTGALATPFAGPEVGADIVRASQAAARQPGPEGAALLQDIAGVGQEFAQNLQVPEALGVLGGSAEILTGQGLPQAAETFQQVQEQGLGEVAGERVLEETGSPLAATVARVAPEAAVEIVAGRGAGRAIQAPEAPLAPVIQFSAESPTKTKVRELLESGEADTEIAKFKLQETPDQQRNRVVRDPQAINAINQGIDEGVVASIKTGSAADRRKMSSMLDTLEKGLRNREFSVTNRPSDVLGNSVVDRFDVVRKTNRDAGRRLDGAAKRLKGRQADFDQPLNNFVDDLDSLGIRFDNGTPNFEGSVIEGNKAAEQLVGNLVKRIRRNPNPDAFQMHQLKKFIDDQVTFGKSAEGLAGQTENVVKSFRRAIDQSLDGKFDEYRRINDTYSETRQVLDDLQDAAGRKIDLTSENANKSLGTLMRGLLSNNRSRVQLLDAITALDNTSAKFGGTFDDSLLKQAIFVDELDRVFGPVARTSFQGQIAQAIGRTPSSVSEAVTRPAIEAVEELLTPDAKSQIAAIRGILAE